MPKKNYIYNHLPIFTPTKKNKLKSDFISYAMKKSIHTDVARNYLNKKISLNPTIKNGRIIFRSRRLNEHRARAMRAMVQAMLYHFNIISQLVEASVEQLADECGLSTVSAAGNKSITRASRLISEFMEPMGFIKCVRKKSKKIHQYTPKKISLTPLFFMLLNIKKEELNDFLYSNRNVLNINIKNKTMSLIQIKQMALLNEEKAKKKILYIIINNYSTKELTKLESKGLKKMVNLEYRKLQKIIKMLNLRTNQ